MKKWLLIIILALFMPLIHAPSFTTSQEAMGPMSPPGWNTTLDYTGDQYNLDAINAYDAWSVETGSSDVTIAVIDTGIDTDHEDFSDRILSSSYNVHTQETGKTVVEDDNGHGTLVAGIIAATRDNSIGIDGLTDNIGLMVIKANQPGEESFPSSYVADGIYHAVDHSADVINLSLGSESMDSGISDAVDYAFDNGVFVVASAGNDGVDNVFYPAGYETVISVGSVNEALERSSFSNYGLTLDLVAPGTNIVTTSPDDTYSLVSGTSFSAPHVSAALALLLSHDSTVSYEETIHRLENSAIDLGEEGKDIYYGHGLLDLQALLIDDIVKISLTHDTSATYDPIWISSGTTLSSLPSPSKEGHTFLGWFLDDSGETAWTSDYLFTEDTTLYAHFSINTYTVTFMLDGDVYATRTVDYNQTMDTLPSVSIDGYDFSGWYLSDAFETPFDNSPITDDLILYGKTTMITHTVTFLSFDGSLYETIIVPEGDSVEDSPSGPPRPDDALYTYIFSHWDHGLSDITQDITANPVYDKTFINNNAVLSPGIDTLETGGTWSDAGVTLNHDALSVDKTGDVDTNTAGTYEVVYDIVHDGHLVHQLTRIVTVIDPEPTIDIVLHAGVSTILKGSDYEDPGAQSNIGTIETSGTIDVNTPGQYIITYTVTHAGIEIRKHRYVYVLGNGFDPELVELWHGRKDDDDEI